MAHIIDFEEEKSKLIARIAFESWMKKFKVKLTHKTAISDLNDEIIKFFVTGSQSPMYLIQNLIIKALYFNKPLKNIKDVPQKDRVEIVNISVFLLDQIRFEAMYRLNWIEHFDTRKIPIIDLITEFRGKYSSYQYLTPALLPDHPRYEEYMNTFDADRKNFIRRLIPDLIDNLS